MKTPTLSAGLAALLLAPALALAAGPYRVTPVGVLEDRHDMVFGADLNGAGMVAGTADTRRGSRAFLWDPARGIADLGSLPGGWPTSGAQGLNDRGEVVGASRAGTPFSPHQAFFWSEPRGMEPLATEPAGGSRARAVNNAATVVGSAWPDGRERLFVWSRADGLRYPVDFTAAAQPRAINDAGTVAGHLTRDGRPIPFRWNAEEGLATLPLPGARGTANAVGADDSVAGRVTLDGETQAFLWRPPGRPRLLGQLRPGAGYSEALDVNAAGVVVGRAVAAGAMRAFIWEPAGGMRALEGLLAADGAELRLFAAPAINDAGQVLVYGQPPGEDRVRSYLLTPAPALASRRDR